MDLAKTASRLTGFLGGQLVVKALYFVGIVAATRAAGPEGWGLLTAALSIGLIGVTAVDLGLKPYVAREVASKRIPFGLLTRSATRFRLVSSALFAVLAPLLLATTVPSTSLTIALLLTGYLLIDSWSQYLFALQRGAETTRFEVQGLIAEKFLFASLAVVVLLRWHEGTTVLLLAGAFAVAALAKLGAAVRGGRSTFDAPSVPVAAMFRGTVSVASWREEGSVIRESMVFLFMAIFTTVYFRIDSYMLAVMAGNEAAGQYGAAYKLIEGLLFAPSGVVAVFGPLTVAALAGRVMAGRADPAGAPDAAVLLRKIAALQLAIGGTLAAGLWLESEWIIDTLYGDVFGPAGILLAWLSVAFLFMSCSFLFGTLMTSLYRQQILLALTVAGATLNVILNLLLIPRMGGLGAVVATIAAEALVVLGMLVHISRHVPARWVLSPFAVTGSLVLILVVVPGLLVQGEPFAIRAPIEIGGAAAVFGILMAGGRIPNPLPLTRKDAAR